MTAFRDASDAARGGALRRVEDIPSDSTPGALLGPIPLPLADTHVPAFVLFAERIDGACLAVLRQQALSRDALILIAYSAGGREDEIKALEAGADECVALGFSVERVLAQFRQLARRCQAAPSDSSFQIQMDGTHHQVQVGGRRIRLSPLEFRLLAELWRQRGRLVSHERAEEALYGASGPDYRQAVRQVVHRLRAKLKVAGDPIHAVAGVGYVLSPVESPDERRLRTSYPMELTVLAPLDRAT